MLIDLSSFPGTVDNDRFAMYRPLFRGFIRLPKHPSLHARRLEPRDDGGTQRKEGSHVRHIRVVPHEQTVLVRFLEAGRGVPSIDAYIAIVCSRGVSDLLRLDGALTLTGKLAFSGRLHVQGVGSAEAVEGPVGAVELSGQSFVGIIGEDDCVCAGASMEGRNYDFWISPLHARKQDQGRTDSCHILCNCPGMRL